MNLESESIFDEQRKPDCNMEFAVLQQCNLNESKFAKAFKIMISQTHKELYLQEFVSATFAAKAHSLVACGAASRLMRGPQTNFEQARGAKHPFTNECFHFGSWA